MIRKILRGINDIILCLRFPFLYPRNRFTGLHYNNWTIINFHRRYYQFLSDFFVLRFIKESELPKDSEVRSTKSIGRLDNMKNTYRIDFNEDKVSIIDIDNYKINWTAKVSDILEQGHIIKAAFINDQETIVISDDSIIKENFSRFISLDRKETILKTIIKVLDWINEYPLQLLHCYPSFTELDAMEPGWRKVFGIRLCKEIRKQLLKEGTLFKFRITDIKEKLGVLTIYHNGSKEIDEIIDKYTLESEKICICCGNPATKKTLGWESYYCDECVPKNQKSININYA
jgi:hypothetical protein